MGKKTVLPILGELARRGEVPARPRKKPSIDAARARLGGRVTRDASQGSGVANGMPAGHAPGAIVLERASSLVGVVVFATAREAHVLFDGGRLARLAPEDVDAVPDAPSPELAKVADDARVFGVLDEGQAVRYADDAGALRDARLVEKCRYGALVLRDDGTLVAVGFRKLWPARGEAGEA